jgi:hypothetical protein
MLFMRPVLADPSFAKCWQIRFLKCMERAQKFSRPNSTACYLQRRTCQILLEQIE